jgi:hypothetical protein
MSVYKLRHFAVLLFQTLNEHVEGLRHFAASGRSEMFAGDLSKIPHAQGVRLILRATDKLYY